MNKQLTTLQNEYSKTKTELQKWHKTDECELQYSTEETPEVMAAFEKGQMLYEAKTTAAEALVNWMFTYSKTTAGRPKSIIERKTLVDLEAMYNNDYSKRIKIREGVADLTMKLRL